LLGWIADIQSNGWHPKRHLQDKLFFQASQADIGLTRPA
jgi:hypothetical protein